MSHHIRGARCYTPALPCADRARTPNCRRPPAPPSTTGVCGCLDTDHVPLSCLTAAWPSCCFLALVLLPGPRAVLAVKTHPTLHMRTRMSQIHSTCRNACSRQRDPAARGKQPTMHPVARRMLLVSWSCYWCHGHVMSSFHSHQPPQSRRKITFRLNGNCIPWHPLASSPLRIAPPPQSLSSSPSSCTVPPFGAVSAQQGRNRSRSSPWGISGHRRFAHLKQPRLTTSMESPI